MKTRLHKREIQELLSDPQWKRDLELEAMLFDKNRTSQLYAHPNGQLLLKIDEKLATLHPVREVWIQAELKFKEQMAKGPQHVLAERLLYGREFDQRIPDLIEGLAQTFKMSVEEFDYQNGDSPVVQTLTRKVKVRGRVKCLHDPVIFSGLVAYLTERGRRAVNGRLVMLQSRESPAIWEPWVVDAHGQTYFMWLDLFDMLLENEYGISMDFGIRPGVPQAGPHRPLPPRANVELASIHLKPASVVPEEAHDEADDKKAPDEG